MLAWFSSDGSQRNSPFSSAVILSHAAPNCGWLIYWSATLLFFLCLLLLTGGSVAGASVIFWPFRCEFPQSSWSINNPLAHDQNSMPVLPPAQRAIVTESGCLWMRLKKKKNENNLEGLSAAAWNFPLWKGHILHKKAEKIVPPTPLQLHWPRGLWG